MNCIHLVKLRFEEYNKADHQARQFTGVKMVVTRFHKIGKQKGSFIVTKAPANKLRLMAELKINIDGVSHTGRRAVIAFVPNGKKGRMIQKDTLWLNFMTYGALDSYVCIVK